MVLTPHSVKGSGVSKKLILSLSQLDLLFLLHYLDMHTIMGKADYNYYLHALRVSSGFGMVISIVSFNFDNVDISVTLFKMYKV